MPDLDFRPVYSGWVSEMAHDPATNEMHIRYSRGGGSIYSDVSAETFETIRRSPSIGEALHALVRSNQPHRSFK